MVRAGSSATISQEFFCMLVLLRTYDDESAANSFNSNELGDIKSHKVCGISFSCFFILAFVLFVLIYIIILICFFQIF